MQLNNKPDQLKFHFSVFLSRGFLTWAGRVTGNDNIYLEGLIFLSECAVT